MNAFREFCEDFDVALVVVSRNRADVLARCTDRLASEYVLFYRGDGYDEHEYRCVERVQVPEGVNGLSETRNFVLRHLTQNVVIFMDDDVKRIHWLGESHMMHITDAQFLIMCMNLVVNALDVKAGVFGISEGDIRKTSPLFPFHTRAVVGGLIGVVGRDLRFDERNRLKVDYDFCLQSIKRQRLMWKDMRYFLFQDRNTLPGGSMPFRVPGAEEREVENLRRWWGSELIGWTDGKGTKYLRVRIP